MNGHATGTSDNPGRDQPGPQPGEGSGPGGRDDGVKPVVDHVRSGQSLGEHLAQGLGMAPGIGLLDPTQHSQGAPAESRVMSAGSLNDCDLCP